MKNWMQAVASTAFVAIGSLALATSAYGQLEFPPIPTNCIIIADEVFVNERPFVSVGTMDLDPGTSVPSDPTKNRPASMQLKNRTFSAKSQDPVLGTVTWDLDLTRPVTTSVLRANQVTALFPATVQLNFNVRATISSMPGRVFLSRTPVSISNGFIRSWPPGEIDLNSIDAANVAFFDQATGETAFIVNRLRSRVRD